MVPFAVVVVDLAVVLWADLDPDDLALFHGEEGLADVLMLLGAVHMELFFCLSFLFEIDQLAIVEPCFMEVVDDVSFLDKPLEFRSRRFHIEFQKATILISSNVDGLSTYTVALDRRKVKPFIHRSFF